MYKEVKNLLSNGNTNAKTKKNSLKTFILYLAPARQNSKGVNLCPMASKGCLAACLYTAGRGKMSNVQESRTNKANYLVEDRKKFYIQLATEIMKKVKTARRTGEKIAFRLNGTSDVDHVKALFMLADFDITAIHDVAVFYDYTAIIQQAIKYSQHKNYFVTFSKKEDNGSDVNEALILGINVSVVFAGDLPKTYKGKQVIDGDQSDIMMIYNRNVVLGLKAKGDAKKDTSGFVIQ